MGCAMFFVCMSLRPELNAKIDIMIGLAPASSVAESMTGLHLQAPFVNHLVVSNIKKLQIKIIRLNEPILWFWIGIDQILFRILGVRAYEPVDSPRNNFRKTFCGPNLFLRYSLCQNPIFATGNDEYRDIDVVSLWAASCCVFMDETRQISGFSSASF
jgi:hypothetical protein